MFVQYQVCVMMQQQFSLSSPTVRKVTKWKENQTVGGKPGGSRFISTGDFDCPGAVHVYRGEYMDLTGKEGSSCLILVDSSGNRDSPEAVKHYAIRTPAGRVAIKSGRELAAADEAHTLGEVIRILPGASHLRYIHNLHLLPGRSRCCRQPL